LRTPAPLIRMAGAAGTKAWTFEEAGLGKTPPGFTPALTGGGGAAARVLKEEPGGLNAESDEFKG
jgi:hypothetical protein